MGGEKAEGKRSVMVLLPQAPRAVKEVVQAEERGAE